MELEHGRVDRVVVNQCITIYASDHPGQKYYLYKFRNHGGEHDGSTSGDLVNNDYDVASHARLGGSSHGTSDSYGPMGGMGRPFLSNDLFD